MYISIEPMRYEDAEFVCLLRNQHKDLLHHNTEFTIEETQNWFMNTSPEWYIIRTKPIPEFDKMLERLNSNLQSFPYNQRVGYIRTSDIDKHNFNMYVGCDILPEYRRLKIATMALIQLRQQCKDRGFHKWFYEVIETNTISMKFALSFGFKIEGVKKEAVYRDGQYLDSVILGLTL